MIHGVKETNSDLDPLKETNSVSGTVNVTATVFPDSFLLQCRLYLIRKAY